MRRSGAVRQRGQRAEAGRKAKALPGEGKSKAIKAAKAVRDWLFGKRVEAIPKAVPLAARAVAAAIGLV